MSNVVYTQEAAHRMVATIKQLENKIRELEGQLHREKHKPVHIPYIPQERINPYGSGDANDRFGDFLKPPRIWL